MTFLTIAILGLIIIKKYNTNPAEFGFDDAARKQYVLYRRVDRIREKIQNQEKVDSVSKDDEKLR